MKHIVDIITKIAAQTPEARQELIDLATLGYREGLIQSKINEIAHLQNTEVTNITQEDIEQEDMEEIVQETENWFRNLMITTARQMIHSDDEDEKIAAREYLMRSGAAAAELIKQQMINNKIRNSIRTGSNRVKASIEELIKENPGLFD